MHNVFDVAFEHLALQHVRNFLAEAGEEGLTWEAKAEGDQRLRTESIRRAVCGLANQIGGFVIVGASRVGDTWALPGIAASSKEPGLWLDQVLSGLRPIPRYAHKHWPAEDDRVVAVIRVEPLTLTPCLTADGQVFERVAGRTIRVTDPTRSHELINRGERARSAQIPDALHHGGLLPVTPGPEGLQANAGTRRSRRQRSWLLQEGPEVDC